MPKKTKKIQYKNFKFKIAGVWWCVELRPEPVMIQDTACYGYCSFSDEKIILSVIHSHTRVKRTFWHEFFHMCTRNLVDETSKVPEEPTADCVGEAMHEVLPQLQKKAKWLFI